MIILMLLSIIFALIAGIGFFVAGEEDYPFGFFLSSLVLILAFCCGFLSYDIHENQMRNYETKTAVQVDTTITINPDKTIDTIYTYHFPKE